MARKTTTKAFREHAVSMVQAGKSTEQVAQELGVEYHKLKRWCKNCDDSHMFSYLFDELDAGQAKKPPCNSTASDKEKRRLEQENKHLRELVHLSTKWISTYVAMHSGT